MNSQRSSRRFVICKTRLSRSKRFAALCTLFGAPFFCVVVVSTVFAQLPPDYVIEQQKADDLLRRTAAIRGDQVEFPNRSNAGNATLVRSFDSSAGTSALVVGNGRYLNAARLRNPQNDAESFANALRRWNVQPQVAFDLDRTDLMRRIRELGATHSNVVFFFAGHGFRTDSNDFIVPIDGSAANAISVRSILDQLKQCRSRLLIFDCCRSETASRASSRFESMPGSEILGALLDTEGTQIWFSTGPSRAAYDGTGNHSPFTLGLLRAINRIADGTAIRNPAAAFQAFSSIDREVAEELASTGQLSHSFLATKRYNPQTRAYEIAAKGISARAISEAKSESSMDRYNRWSHSVSLSQSDAGGSSRASSKGVPGVRLTANDIFAYVHSQ